MTVLPNLSQELELAKKMIADQQAMLEKLMASKDRRLGLKVSEKGAVCLTGLRRFPTTLYKREWLRVLDMADEIRAFIKANDRLLVDKRGED